MATVSIIFCTAGGRPNGIGSKDSQFPVIDLRDYVEETITSSASSQVTTAASVHREGSGFVEVTSTGGNVRLAIGATPTAVNNAGPILLDGQTRSFLISKDDKVAVIDSA